MLYQKGSNLFNVAIYIRLSREDGDKEESDSVGNQRKLLTEYVNKHDDFILYDVYIDDGFTGTNFNRPDFHRMIADIEDNKVNCVVVKDDCVIIEPTQKDLENQGFVAGSICF